jgi:hypothetical protein
MAKQANTYASGPWYFKKDEVKQKFIRVDESNRKNACVNGRILYIIEGSLFRGSFVLQPCFPRGGVKMPWKPWEAGYPGHYRVFLDTDSSIDEHVKTYRTLITQYIEEQTLYINPKDPILKFLKDEQANRR